MEHGLILNILAIAFSFFMAWGVGANDVANAMGTSVGSKAITLIQAIIIATIFELLGALLAGGQVTNTIRGKIIEVSALHGDATVLIYGMLASLLAAGTWLIIATKYGWPVSTTHSIIGAVVGFGSVVLGIHAIHWDNVADIATSWVFTPVIAGVLAYLLFLSVQKLIFEAADPIVSAKRIVPFYIFLVSFVITFVTFLSGLEHVGIHWSYIEDAGAAFLLSIVMTFIGMWALHRITVPHHLKFKQNIEILERIFGILMVFTACAMAFAHGSNDVANAIGPLAAVEAIIASGGQLLANNPLPFWVLGIGGLGIVLGLVTYGYKVIATIGTAITELTPSRGFAAQLSCATTVVIASGLGLPISTSQTLVGAVLGVGFARGIGALNLGIIRNIFVSWVITFPAGAILAIIYYFIIKLVLGG